MDRNNYSVLVGPCLNASDNLPSAHFFLFQEGDGSPQPISYIINCIHSVRQFIKTRIRTRLLLMNNILEKK